MNVIVIGLGIQGRKRQAVAGADVVATVDPVVPGATYRRVEDVPVADYDAALVCTPDATKIQLLTFLADRGKHVLVEKPLLAADEDVLREIERLVRTRGTVCYTAYNHRFEPHLVRMKRLLDEGSLGRIYQVSMFYGNGTARDVRNSPWRDQGLGVIPDLASHMLDLCLFCFGRPQAAARPWNCARFENAAFDYFALGFPDASPRLMLEGTLLSWRNTFSLDVFAEQGSAHVAGLCKWGPSSFVVRRRVLPSGRPPEEVHTLEQPDPTWAAEYQHFLGLCESGGTNIDNDIWINGVLNSVGRSLGVEQRG
jgi:scyllo-inositol 2-dehydrogenase (NADP+)